MDGFEKMMRDKRAELDVEEPRSEYLWEGVQNALTKRSYAKKLNRWRMAATLLAFVALGQAAYMLGNYQWVNRQVQSQPGQDTQGGAFLSLEQAYAKQVSALESRLKEKKVDPERYAVLYDELQYMDKMEQEFENEIPLANDKERIAQMLADTYEKKIQLLERLLQQIEREERAKDTYKEL